ncbi:MAG: hypothetical protein ACREIV_13010, partial [Planctomycetaceae bacterium]
MENFVGVVSNAHGIHRGRCSLLFCTTTPTAVDVMGAATRNPRQVRRSEMKRFGSLAMVAGLSAALV